jgi:hypothetical protein
MRRVFRIPRLDPDIALRWQEQTVEMFRQRRFARPIVSDDRKILAALNIE